MLRVVTFFAAFLVTLTSLPATNAAAYPLPPDVPATPAVEWTVAEAAAQYMLIARPWNREQARINRIQPTEGNVRRYCRAVVRMMDKANRELTRGLWPAITEAEVKRLLRASVVLRSRYFRCQTRPTGERAWAILTRTSQSNGRLWDVMGDQVALIRMTLGLPPA